MSEAGFAPQDGSPRRNAFSWPARSLAAFARECISSPLNVAVTAAILIWIGATLPDLIRWAFVDAVWDGASPRACANVDAACWLFIRERMGQILYGLYPPEQRWRAVVCAGIGALALAALAAPWRNKWSLAILIALAYPVIAGVILRGGLFGLTPVPTSLWGGLMLTIVVAAWTIATALPMGLALALARRSTLPIVAGIAALYIDIVRGLPLVGILFLAIVLFPLFVPPGIEINVLVRAMIAFTLFNAASMAEVIRGGIQAVPKGQTEAAMSLGLGYWRMMTMCILPQAMRAALPGIVNVSIAIIKETTIILIAGLFDLLGVLQGALIDPEWNIGDHIRQTAYFFAGTVFFVICFTLSQLSARLERRLDLERTR